MFSIWIEKASIIPVRFDISSMISDSVEKPLIIFNSINKPSIIFHLTESSWIIFTSIDTSYMIFNGGLNYFSFRSNSSWARSAGSWVLSFRSCWCTRSQTWRRFSRQTPWQRWRDSRCDLCWVFADVNQKFLTKTGISIFRVHRR